MYLEYDAMWEDCVYMISMAGIVTYNPDIERLKDNLRNVSRQFNKIVLFDNCSENMKQIERLLQEYSDRCVLINSNKNMGIGYALNRIMEYAEKQNVNWVLLLDQDSVIPANMLEQYLKMQKLESAAVVCPQICDKNSKQFVENRIEGADIDEIGICITSGSYNKVEVWRKLGKFREDFFIDSVDNEYCIRLYFAGFKIYRNNNVVLDHELGKTRQHFIKNTTNHNPMRRYYIARNATYVANIYEKKLNKTEESARKRREISKFLDELVSKRVNFRRQIQFILLVLLYEEKKFCKIQNILRGMGDGKKMAVHDLKNT